MKRLLKLSLLTILLGMFVLSIPGKANATESGYSYWQNVNTGAYNSVYQIYCFIESDGTYTVKAYLDYSKANPYDNFVFFLLDEDNNLAYFQDAEKKGTDVVRKGTDSTFTYTFKTHVPGGRYRIGGFGYSDQSEKGSYKMYVMDNTSYIDIPKSPYLNIETINLAERTQHIKGTIRNSKQTWTKTYYKLNATEDAMLNINNVKLSSSFEIKVLEFDGVPSDSNNPTNYPAGYQIIQKTGDKLENYAMKKGGSYYLLVDGDDGDDFEFDIEFRKYRHAKVKWSIKEGGINSSFPQKKTLHVTMQITNKDSDARFSKDARFLCAGYIDDDKITVSSDGMKGNFTFKTRDFPTVDTVKVYLKELNLSNEENQATDLCLYTLDITTGISMTNFNIETGSNYILFPDFRGTMFVDDGKTKVNVYLKVGKKWKKKFTANAGSNKPKKIKKLKPKKKYKVKIEIARKLSNGKTVKNNKVVTVKTGPKTKPVIASARVSNYKIDKVWVSGHYDANFVWHPGYYSKNTSYTMTITLSKPLKGCKGLVYEGVKCKGSGTTFTFTVLHRQPPSKATVRGYSDEKYYGYTPVSNAKAVSR